MPAPFSGTQKRPAERPPRPPVSLSQGSCAYGLKLREEYLPAAVQILKKNGLAVVGVWRQTPEGRWREVVW